MTYLANNPRFLNTVLLGGPFSDQLTAIAQAGFAGIELWQQDVGDEKRALVRQLTALNLAITDYQVLLDFDGAVGAHRHQKRLEAEGMLHTAAALGTKMILVAASTAECDVQRIVPDLAWLCAKAQPLGLRIAYEPMAWSTIINRYDLAWEIIEAVAVNHLGLVVDAFHLYAKQRSLTDLQGIPADKIFLLQLSDLAKQCSLADCKRVARHQRLLPGEGYFPLQQLVSYLDKLGYCGPVGLEVFNDHYAKQSPARVAEQAMQSLTNLLNTE